MAICKTRQSLSRAPIKLIDYDGMYVPATVRSHEEGNGIPAPLRGGGDFSASTSTLSGWAVLLRWRPGGGSTAVAAAQRRGRYLLLRDDLKSRCDRKRSR